MFAVINALVAIVNNVASKENVMGLLFAAIVFGMVALVVVVVRSIVFVTRQLLAQNKVNRLYNRLTMWKTRSEEGDAYYEYDVATKSIVRWDIETMETLVEKYQGKFNRAVEARDSIRF